MEFKSVIETERTLLRPFTLTDVVDLHEITKQQKVMRYVAHPHQSLKETEDTIHHGFLPHYQQYGYGRLAIINKTDNRLIGFSGLKYLEDIKEVDLAYTLHPEFWRRGLATEVAKACLVFASKSLNMSRVIGLSTPTNKSSIHVMTKIGMHYEKNILFWGEEYQQYAWHV